MGAKLMKRAGFTLIEIVIALAIVALLAGAVTPLVYKEIQRTREEATLKELAGIQEGLREFFADTGRFPTEAEGLPALVADPGVTGWSGPYMGGNQGDPTVEITTDSYGIVYSYDLAPTTNPADAADALVASNGPDQVLSFGSVGGTWNINAEGDDLLVLVSSGSLNRQKTQSSQVEMEAIALAARKYFEDHAAFPATLSDLTEDYMDRGFTGSAYTDEWNNSYTIAEDGGTPPTLTITSRGPDQTDNGGGGDDFTLEVSSIPPGRNTTSRRLEIAQTALNNDPNANLDGDWAVDLVTLGLASVFENDGWGQKFRINTGARTIYSVGPDGNASTVGDNLPPGIGP
jgi:general secretion pathway protein G